ncbi:DUF3817 domain-containing protein [Nakamurella flavida]|uniref:DUF3817 domain-containing protein n=1 Tax=Nakamurella flavida TaxID=363630 RepID=A0A939C3A4_9ACTN|nr:DUF3817 domain-containing protein [Nakamurella flavida]MBM9476866.1 DUF3817 domain-containing protein [Nakamurella flavida]MDP9779810.1 integral membrane protein [Nakamurella flavida]
MSATALVKAFRLVSFAEAVSWTGLLIGMFFKWVVQSGEVGVQVFGPIHGAVFVAYVVIALLTARAQRWSLWTTFLALGASIPPLFTLWFERWAHRTGHLDPARAGRTATA